MRDEGVGIYKISLVSYPKERLLYIGQSRYLRRRIVAHKKSLDRGTHHNLHLQNIFRKYGPAGFRFVVLEECSVAELDSREKFYIDTLSPECNIILDPTQFATSRRDFKPEPPLLDIDIPGLELDWKGYQPWHRAVYGAGRGKI